ncbi:MAG: winged helix-turn-helix transcriptional regulator [Pyrinomonadaceae bacterium]|nr:winged helix-turn-helix transcriptional regulator [Pyrinomonadaceae bacterium]
MMSHDPHSLAEDDILALEQLFITLADPTRIRMAELMAQEESAVGQLADALGESQPKISRHLAYLRNHGLVTSRRDGKNVFYRLCEPTNDIARKTMNSIIGTWFRDDRAYRPQHTEQPDLSPEHETPAHNEIEVFLL